MTVEKVETEEQLEAIFKIREEVFVIEQEVDPAEEYDEYENTSTHFLVRLGGKPAGTARWRYTANGIKLERFAVLKEMRCKGVGQLLVKSVLEDISSKNEAEGKTLYMHAQLAAISLYEKFGFKKVGEMFEECNIRHYKLELNLFNN